MCDSGKEIGCLEDCSASIPGMFCEGGTVNTPSVCFKGFDPQGETAVNSVKSSTRTSVSVGSSLNALGALPRLLTLGPGLFMLVHLSSIF